MIEENLLLYYPWTAYFVPNKNNSKLAERIEKVMNRMVADGSYDRIFHKYDKSAIDRANLKNRRLFKISNQFCI